MDGIPDGSCIRGRVPSTVRPLERVPQTFGLRPRLSAPPPLHPVLTLHSEVITCPPPSEQNARAKREFQRLCRLYIRRQTPSTVKDMQALAALSCSFDWIDVIEWQAVLQRGIILDTDTGLVTFHEFSLHLHELIIWQFSSSFSRQFINPWERRGVLPNFQYEGTVSKPSKHYSMSEVNVADFEYPGNLLIAPSDLALAPITTRTWLHWCDCNPFSVSRGPQGWPVSTSDRPLRHPRFCAWLAYTGECLFRRFI